MAGAELTHNGGGQFVDGSYRDSCVFLRQEEIADPAGHQDIPGHGPDGEKVRAVPVLDPEQLSLVRVAGVHPVLTRGALLENANTTFRWGYPAPARNLQLVKLSADGRFCGRKHCRRAHG